MATLPIFPVKKSFVRWFVFTTRSEEIEKSAFSRATFFSGQVQEKLFWAIGPKNILTFWGFSSRRVCCGLTKDRLQPFRNDPLAVLLKWSEPAICNKLMGSFSLETIAIVVKRQWFWLFRADQIHTSQQRRPKSSFFGNRQRVKLLRKIRKGEGDFRTECAYVKSKNHPWIN